MSQLIFNFYILLAADPNISRFGKLRAGMAGLIYFISHRPPCSEVLCLGIVTFEQGVAWLTGSYSMGLAPEEHPCVLRGKGFQPRIKYGVTCDRFDPTFRVR